MIESVYIFIYRIKKGMVSNMKTRKIISLLSAAAVLLGTVSGT